MKKNDIDLEKVNKLRKQGKSWPQIAKIFKVSEDTVRKRHNREKGSSYQDKNTHKVLILDIETKPIIGYVWGLWDNNVSLNQIKEDWCILSWSAKWLGSPAEEVMYLDQRNADDINDDSEILRIIWELLDEADCVLTQNGKSFDIKKLNARFILHGFPPPSSFRHIDTKILAKKSFAFTSNKLEYMTDKLCTKYKKLKHSKFSGFDLWKECMAGNIEAWKEMELYNKYDVLSLEELYYKLAPWDNSINLNTCDDDYTERCTCGSTHFKEHGFVYTNTAKHQRYICETCGKETRDRENLLSKIKKASLKK